MIANKARPARDEDTVSIALHVCSQFSFCNMTVRCLLYGSSRAMRWNLTLPSSDSNTATQGRIVTPKNRRLKCQVLPGGSNEDSPSPVPDGVGAQNRRAGVPKSHEKLRTKASRQVEVKVASSEVT